MYLKYSYFIYFLLIIDIETKKFKLKKNERELMTFIMKIIIKIIIKIIKEIIKSIPKPIFFRIDRLGTVKGADLRLVM
jgi:hypothetical protein